MLGRQLNLFDPTIDLRGYPIRVRASYSRLQSEVYRQRVEDGRFKYGRLAGAKRWSDPRYWREVDISRKSVGALVAHGLVHWEGDDLILSHYDRAADERADAFSKKQRENVNRRWHPDRESDRVSDRVPDRFLPPKPAQPFKTADTKPIPARARASGSGSGSGSGSDLSLSEDRSSPTDRQTDSAGLQGPVESVGWGLLTLGEQRVWRAFPRAYRPWDRLDRFAKTWRRLELEHHADWVLDFLDECKITRGWERGMIPYPDNWLENRVGPEEKPVIDGCPADCCRGKWSKKSVPAGVEETEKATPLPAYATPEQLDELRATRAKIPAIGKQGSVRT